MGMDMAALRAKQKGIESKSGGNDDVFYASSLTKETKGRIGPPTKAMGGIYFIELKIYWINDKPYVCPSSFEEDSVIAKEIAKALKSGDDDIIQLAEAIREAYEYYFPVLLYDDVDDKLPNKVWKIFSCGPMMIKEVNKIATHRNYQPDITDPVDGFDICFTKEGKGLKTEYKAFGERNPTEIPEKFYDEVPDVIAYAKGRVKDDNFLKGVIRNYLYDEEMPADSKRAKNTDLDDKKSKSRRTDDDDEPRGRSRRNDDDDEPRSRGRRDDDDEPRSRRRDDDDEPKSRSRRADDDDDEPRSRRRSDDDDEPKSRRRDDDDEPKSRRRADDDDDEPKSRRKPADDDDDEPKSRRRADDDDDEPRSRRRTDDDDDEPKSRRKPADDDDEPPFETDPVKEEKVEKKAPSKAASKKAAAADKPAAGKGTSKRLIDDLDD